MDFYRIRNAHREYLSLAYVGDATRWTWGPKDLARFFEENEALTMLGIFRGCYMERV